MPIVGSAAQLGNKRNLHVKCLNRKHVLDIPKNRMDLVDKYFYNPCTTARLTMHLLSL